jgi:hypothetical protein
MVDGLPARIDRAALERIIQRAAELQTADREIGEGLTTDQVMELGREVGIPGQFLQQALLEERTRIVQAGPEGLLGRTIGPAAIAAQRVVQGERESIETVLIDWMEKQELFSVQRHQPGRITWEPTGGFQAAYRRAVGAAGKRPIMLAKADTVSATVLALEPGYHNVTLSATAKKRRNESVAGSAALAGLGAAGTGLLAAVGALLPVVLVPLPLGLGLGYLVVRQYGPVVQRIQLGLERVLDQLEHGRRSQRGLPPPPRLIDLLANEVRKALSS